MKRVMATALVLTLLAAVAPWFASVGVAETYRVISWGASGGDVSEAQAILQSWGYYDGPVDAVFGAETSEAVKRFQWLNGLTVDGIIGPETWAGLGITMEPAVAVSGSPVGQEFNADLLARLIRGEAEAEPYEGKVAVAAVLLNRMRDARFPNTLEGVIYEVDAFESVGNGRIYDTPPTPDDLQAARDALSGWDPTFGAVFFWNPSKAVSPWIWSRPIITQIGSHVFAR